MIEVAYTQEFLKSLKCEFGAHSKIHKLACEGNLHELGALLDDARKFDGSCFRISKMLYQGFTKKLEKEATVAVRREEIYSVWYEFYEKATSQQNQDHEAISATKKTEPVTSDLLQLDLFGANYD